MEQEKVHTESTCTNKYATHKHAHPQAHVHTPTHIQPCTHAHTWAHRLPSYSRWGAGTGVFNTCTIQTASLTRVRRAFLHLPRLPLSAMKASSDIIACVALFFKPTLGNRYGAGGPSRASQGGTHQQLRITDVPSDPVLRHQTPAEHRKIVTAPPRAAPCPWSCHGTIKGRGLLKSHGLSETPIVWRNTFDTFTRED